MSYHVIVDRDVVLLYFLNVTSPHCHALMPLIKKHQVPSHSKRAKSCNLMNALAISKAV